MSPTGLRYMDGYRDAALAEKLSAQVYRFSKTPVRLMEVCGGHTAAIHKYGLKDFLPGTINLLSGPGCPVCVSSQKFVDQAIFLGRRKGVILTTYGDLVRVPGSVSSLEKEKSRGADIRMVYSVLDAVKIAKENRGRQVVFLGIGFETTAPASAAAIMRAEQEKVYNFFLLSAHKVMPPALESLAGGDTQIDGFLAPGHVSAITGTMIYQKLADVYHRGVVVSGFEPADILQSVLLLIKQVESGHFLVENEYTRVVKKEGNPRAIAVMNRVFNLVDAEWRGLGIVPESGLAIAPEFANHDANLEFNIRVPDCQLPKGCICGDILTGRKNPAECSLFSVRCTPVNPIGACMVSSEGACSVYYKYKT